ncbi:MAG TPA: methionine ABC transporter permease [Opitutae bacterium]|nr:methionine ABC transporter permease [Opitutae bacterium]|tara:strand:- start:275 stop:913 length:639 start_codon:yes stop_codon:yes gene_type:complete
MTELILESTWQTILMVTLSSVIGLLVGIPLGVFLFITDKGHLCQNLWINRSASLIINAIRSIPYIILVIALIPMTRLIVGTSIGTLAATVPLSIAAIMLFVRIVEDALRIVPTGLTEAALSMGATRMQVTKKVLLPEALPSIVSGSTLVIISLIGFSAMAGAVGGGGLGDLAIRYGYQRYNLTVVLEVIAILVVMVQCIQVLGDRITKKIRK